MTYNRFVFTIIIVCALQLAPLIMSGTHDRSGETSNFNILHRSDEGSRLHVLDRIVDGAYGVFLVGLEEKEVVIPLGPRCVALLSRRPNLAAGNMHNVRDRIGQKLSALRQRDSGLSVAE